MFSHLRAILWLLGLTLLLCCVVYPLVLLGIGQTVFHDQAQGSLITDKEGKPLGSRLIAQPFGDDKYFQPRPSAVSYNATASGGSNWSANNPLLRERVAQQLGMVVKYGSGPKKGQRIAPDILDWLERQPGILFQWARQHPNAPGLFFDLWRKAHPDVDLEPVPADLVTASGSGLDPHITLKGALYQLDRVAWKWAKETNKDAAQLRKEIEALLQEKATSPLAGLAGVPMVNVLEVNLALRDRYLPKQQ